MFRFACRFCALAALAAGCLAAQPVSASTESAMLEEAQNTPDRLARIHLLSRFVERFPESESLGWALRTLQDGYAEINYLRSSILFGQRVLDLYPNDVESAEKCLKVAVKVGDSRLTRKYAVETWQRASRAQSQNVMQYAESVLAVLAVQDDSAENRAAAVHLLAKLNPNSPFLPDLYNSADRLANPAIPRIRLLRDINDPEALVEEAGRLTKIGTNYAKVWEYTQRAIELMGTHSSPEDPKRDRYLTAARWMSGMAATILGRYWAADRELRGALPALRGNPQALSITLYSLGYVNFQLAEAGQRKRIFEALKFNAECAALPGAYQEQARKNIEAIKMFYNMQ